MINAEIIVERLKVQTNSSNNVELATKLLLPNSSTISGWVSRNAIGTILQKAIEYAAREKQQLDFNRILSNDIEPEPQNQKLQNILDDLLCFYGTREETAKELEIYLIDKILDRFSVVANEAIAKFLDSLIFIDGDPIRARPFLFLYYIFHIIVTKKEEMPEENFKAFVIQKINDFKIFSSENNPGFTIKIKNAVIEVIEVKFSEDECRNLVKNAPTVLNLLEKRMPMSLVKTHKNKFN